MMRSHRLAPPPPPPELIDDTIAEILLRLSPDDPACLVRASLVCKLWHRILSEPTFAHRYREFHGTPPLLGFVCGYAYAYTSGHGVSDRFFPVTTARIPFRQPAFRCQALDCRHGRVLLDAVDGTDTARECHLAVWDPVTGDHKVLSDPDPTYFASSYSGAVVCAAAGCDHRGCHGGGPFQVVFVTTSISYDDEGTNNAARAWVYSSETAAWSAPASVQIQFDGYLALVERTRAAIVGDQIYFLLNPGDAGILKYDLGKRCLTVVGSPYDAYIQHGILMTTEDGSLGLISVKDDEPTTLYLLRATKGNNPNGSMGWVQDRVILLDKLLDPSIIQTTTEDTYSQVIRVVGFAEGVDILLLGEYGGGRGFMFELKSGRIRELSKPDEYYYYCYDVFFPYLSFYIPDFASHKKQLPAERQNNNE